MMCGGISQVKDVQSSDTLLLDAVAAVKKNVEEQLKATFETFEPVKYTSQVVAGASYQVKVKVGDGKYVHVKIWSKPDQSRELSACQGDKSLDDAFAF